MGARVEKFSNIKTFTDKVYCDTNFILKLQGYIYDSTDVDFEAHHTFWEMLHKNNVSLFTSTLAINEAIHINFYLNGIHEEIKKYLGMSTEDSLPKSKIYNFKKNNPGIYKQYYNDSLPAVKDLLQFLYNSEFIILPTPPSLVYNGTEVSEYAVYLIENYPEIGVADALQIAIASCISIKVIATADKGFYSVDGITVYTPD